MENRICTTIEQSEKLIELGIDPDTADMFYWYGEKNDVRIGTYDYHGGGYFDTPAWSLSALLGLMPKLYDEDDLNDGGCQPNLCKGWDNNLWHCVYRVDMYRTEWYDEPIDAAFDMVCWLLKNNKI